MKRKQRFNVDFAINFQSRRKKKSTQISTRFCCDLTLPGFFYSAAKNSR